MEGSGVEKREGEEVRDYNSNNVNKARLHSTLKALLDDPILADVPKQPTLSDVDTLISLELGSAMRISVSKLAGPPLGIKMIFPIFILFFFSAILLHAIFTNGICDLV